MLQGYLRIISKKEFVTFPETKTEGTKTQRVKVGKVKGKTIRDELLKGVDRLSRVPSMASTPRINNN